MNNYKFSKINYLRTSILWGVPAKNDIKIIGMIRAVKTPKFLQLRSHTPNVALLSDNCFPELLVVFCGDIDLFELFIEATELMQTQLPNWGT